MKLAQVIEELVEERGLDRNLLGGIICEGLLAAYSKRYPDLVFNIVYNKKTDEIETKVQKIVVATVEDDDAEITLRKARAFDPNVEIDGKVEVPFDGKIGRIEILRAKQVIATQIRGVEASAIFNEYKNKQNTIVHATIHKCERNGMSLKLDEALAFLPRSLSLPSDKCIVGYSIRALLKEVLVEPRNDYQLILDRASADFVAHLFELEIPEIFEKIVEIKKIVRIAGYKTKIAVISHDKNIDPVGTCVGVGGVRIKPILKELGGEKIDVIPWRDSIDDLIIDALKPAVISRVEISSDGRSAQVWLDEDQRSLAIGKLGQNISLASQLTGVHINLVQSEGGAIQLEDDMDENIE